MFLFNFYSYSGQSLVVNDVFPPLYDKIRELQKIKNLKNADYDSDYGDDSDSESSSVIRS